MHGLNTKVRVLVKALGRPWSVHDRCLCKARSLVHSFLVRLQQHSFFSRSFAR